MKSDFNNELGHPVYPSSDEGKEIGFTSDKFSGYLWNNEDGTIIISLIKSYYEGRGNIKELLDILSSKFHTIVIPVASARMEYIANKYGFVNEVYAYSDGESFPSLVFKSKNYKL